MSKASGRAEVDDVLAAVRPTTCLVTVMLANNETGVVMVSRPAGTASPSCALSSPTLGGLSSPTPPPFFRSTTLNSVSPLRSPSLSSAGDSEP